MPAKILLCLDTDPQPSVFDSVVAIDSGAEHLLRHSGVRPQDVEGLVHGAMFTRGPADLKNTAVFIGGSNVPKAEALLAAATQCFFGPIRVSVMLDPNGANTTAAAAVLAAARHVELQGDITAAIVGTGPVGQRAALMLAMEGVRVRLVSRSEARARQACDLLTASIDGGQFIPFGSTERPLAEALSDAKVLIACGPAGVQVLDNKTLSEGELLRVVIDLNAAPPAGVEGMEVMDKAVQRGEQVHYGAIGVGGDKMKIHKAAIGRLFKSNDAVLDAAEIYTLGKSIVE
ncbi:MAG: FAD-dependent monooxygenase [Planctomycetales bacterium]|nr:FAD-dependent monooxygenase [Planctomycetales bacterium]